MTILKDINDEHVEFNYDISALPKIGQNIKVKLKDYHNRKGKAVREFKEFKVISTNFKNQMIVCERTDIKTKECFSFFDMLISHDINWNLSKQ